jgi:hypothetical protein
MLNWSLEYCSGLFWPIGVVMNTRNFVFVLVAFVAGVVIALAFPAIAQQSEAQQSESEGPWKVTMSRPAQSTNNTEAVYFTKHNQETGQILVLNCDPGGNLCNKAKWHDLPVAGSK